MFQFFFVLKKHDTIRIFLEQATMLYAFACARRRKNEVQKPSSTQSKGQDGVFRGAHTGLGGPKRGSKLPIPGPKTEGLQSQRTKSPKGRLQISPKSSSSRWSPKMSVFPNCGVWPPEGLAQQVRENVKMCSRLVQEALFWFRKAKVLDSNAFFGGTGVQNEPKRGLRKGSQREFWRGIFGSKSEDFVKKVYFSLEKGKIRVPKE